MVAFGQIFELLCSLVEALIFTRTGILTVILLLLLTLFWRSQYFAFYSRQLPPGPVLIPLIGCIPGVIGEFTGDWFAEQSRKFKSKVISMRMFGGILVSLNDYDLIKEVFMKRPDVVDRQEIDLFKVADSEREGMILTSGRLWKESRRFALHMMRDFGMGKAGAEEFIVEESEKAARAFREYGGQPFDPLSVVNMAVSNIINSIVFGRQFEYSDPKFKHGLAGLNDFMRRLSEPKTVLLMTNIGQFFLKKDLIQLRASYKIFDDFVVDEIEEHKKTYKGQVTDFIYAYLAEMESTDDRTVFNEKQLRYLIQDLFLAGSETTFTTLRWALLYMAAYPEIQQKVYEELITEMGDSLPSMKHRKHTSYADAVLSEVQRFNTLIGLGVAHTNISEDFEIEGYSLPKGTPVLANLQQVHRDERFWKKPNEFYPENFLDEDGNFINADKLVPFSIGRRQCAGESLARMELYLFFTGWIKAFQIKMETETTVPDLIGNIVGINQPKFYKIRMVPRDLKNGICTDGIQQNGVNANGIQQNGLH